MNIIIFGAPGAGKGTQSDLLAKNFSLKKISTGDLLREEINNKSDLGKKIKDLIEKGQLVSDEIIIDLIENIFKDQNKNFNFVFDGFPRTLKQAEILEKKLKNYNEKIDFVFNLEVNRDEIIKRISGRIFCTKCNKIFNNHFNSPLSSEHKCGDSYLKKRADDTVEVVEKRYDTYIKQTVPLIKFYIEANNLHTVSGLSSINEIFGQITSLIKQ